VHNTRVDFIDYSPHDRLGFGLSMLLVYGLGTVVLGTVVTLLAVLTARHYRRLRQALDAQDKSEHPTLSLGHAVLSGTVETDDPKVPAVTVEVDQAAREYAVKGGQRHEWKETARRVSAKPFWLVLDSGERVRVEPPDDVFLIDSLEEKSRESRMFRTYAAQLEQGERATVTGILRREQSTGATSATAGYRDQGTAFVLRGVRGERMLISTEPLPERHRRWARFYAVTTAIVGAIFLFAHLVLWAPFHALNVRGVDADAVVKDRSTWVVKGKSTTTHYKIFAHSTTYNVDLADETTAAAYNSAVKGQPVPFLIVPTSPATFQIGLAPGVSVFNIMLFTHPTIFGLVGFFLLRKKRLAWYEQKLVTHNLTGPLV
jgi:hypothetical protein